MLNVTADQLRAAWRAGKIAAAPDTEAVLAPVLGARPAPSRLAGEHPALDADHWAIVPAHELVPSWSVLTVAGQHPLVGDGPPLYTRTEHGQPRLLSDAERAELPGQLAATAAAAMAPPEPWAHPALTAEGRTRPDSLVIRGKSQPLTVTVPERVDPGARYRLIVDLTAQAAPIADAFVVTRTGASVATGPEIARFMEAKYPIDPARSPSCCRRRGTTPTAMRAPAPLSQNNDIRAHPSPTISGDASATTSPAPHDPVVRCRRARRSRLLRPATRLGGRRDRHSRPRVPDVPLGSDLRREAQRHLPSRHHLRSPHRRLPEQRLFGSLRVGVLRRIVSVPDPHAVR